MKNIIRSRLLWIFAAALIVVTGVSFFLADAHEHNDVKVIDPVEIGEADARTVIPFSNYNRMEIFDAEEGIFIAGREYGSIMEYTYDVIDRNGEVIRSFAYMGELEDFTDKFIKFYVPPEGEEFGLPMDRVLIFEDGIRGDYDDYEYMYWGINKKNKDILIEESEEFKVTTESGKVIYRLPKDGLNCGDDGNRYYGYTVRFAGDTDYIKAVREDYSCSLINYKTGEEVYRTKKDEEIMGRTCGKWEVCYYRTDHNMGELFLNDDFTPAFGGKPTGNYRTNGKYISFGEMDDRGWIDANHKVFYSDGTEFDYSEYGKELRGFAGDLLYVADDLNRIKAVKMEGPDKGSVVREGTDVCYMDYEDGIALCCDKRKHGEDAPEIWKDTENWTCSWKYVDEDYNALTNGEFYYAEPSQNGYAVVGYIIGNKKCYGVIDFFKDRGEM